jgi:hypothetical protein
MAIIVDISQVLRRPADLLHLVEAVVAALPTDEAEWVEWKSDLPLDALDGWFSISKQVLGFANRDPDRAARFAGGNGYVIVGAEPGNVRGITPVDPAQLDNWLRSFLGNDGPVWSANYVTVERKEVLVVVVEAPRWGDRIYPLRRTHQPQARGQGADKGTIFVRRQASTGRANDAEMDMLQERLLRGQRQPPLDLGLGWRGEPTVLSPIDATDEARQSWVDARRQVLLQSLRNYEPRTAAARQAEKALRLRNMFQADNRSADQYQAEVEEYLRGVSEPLVSLMASRLFKAGTNEIRLVLTNPSDRNLPRVKLSLHLPGRLAAFDREPSWKLPDAPRPFGAPRPLAGLRELGPAFDSTWIRSTSSAARVPLSLEIENGGSAKLTFQVGDLRPRDTADLDAFTLVVAEPAGGPPVKATWSATSTGVDGICERGFEFPLADRALTPLDLVPYEEEREDEESSAR